ncbi:MAG: hypothetical protein K2X93_11370 [Candidatus Obscuribacterales bacterium]|nr:hypothetical protein [Candidatus Obscuribacterales bacterium]
MKVTTLLEYWRIGDGDASLFGEGDEAILQFCIPEADLSIDHPDSATHFTQVVDANYSFCGQVIYSDIGIVLDCDSIQFDLCGYAGPPTLLIGHFCFPGDRLRGKGDLIYYDHGKELISSDDTLLAVPPHAYACKALSVRYDSSNDARYIDFEVIDSFKVNRKKINQHESLWAEASKHLKRWLRQDGR